MTVDIARAKQMLSCIDYLNEHGFPVRNGRTKSWLHNGNNPNSVLVTDDHWYSFSDDKGGDIIDLVAWFECDGNKGQAIKHIGKITGTESGGYSATAWKDYTQDLITKCVTWNKNIPDRIRDYIHSRGITDKTINDELIGWDGRRITIPYFKNGYVCYVVRRKDPASNDDSAKYIKDKLSGYNENVWAGMRTLHGEKKRNDTLIIAEGAFDYLSFVQEGYHVLSAIGGTPNAEQRKFLQDVAQNYKTVFLTYDRDDTTHTGQKFDTRTFDLLFPVCKDIRIAKIPVEDGKDVSDYYQRHGSLEPLLNNAEDGIIWKVRTFKGDPSAITLWCENNLIRVPFYRIRKALTALRVDQTIDDDLCDILQKTLSKAPADIVISRLILSKHKLIYAQGLGFYEFHNGFWNYLDDTEVMKYISFEYGQYSTGARIKSVLTVIKSVVFKPDVAFNHKPLVSFRNGVLELESGILRAPQESDYLSYKLHYSYDKNARCPKWVRFVYEITASDWESHQQYDWQNADVLQEFAGYILFPNNNLYQSALVLEGQGANGKSVFINVLSAMIGGENSGNVTSVGIDQLGKDFYPILLANSMLNINTEIKSNVAGAESIFKAAVAGDPITSSKKGKDNYSFRTRAKFVISTNSAIITSDVSEGFFRRLIIIQFPMHYTDNPDPNNPTDKLMNRNIEAELLEELPGIFNWAYDGYRSLNENGYFYATKKSDLAKKELEMLNDTVYAFCTEYDFNDEAQQSFETIYTAYRNWCDEQGSRACVKRSFALRVSKLVDSHKISWKKIRRNSYKGYSRI